jgi:hypothetical protein
MPTPPAGTVRGRRPNHPRMHGKHEDAPQRAWPTTAVTTSSAPSTPHTPAAAAARAGGRQPRRRASPASEASHVGGGHVRQLRQTGGDFPRAHGPRTAPAGEAATTAPHASRRIFPLVGAARDPPPAAPHAPRACHHSVRSPLSGRGRKPDGSCTEHGSTLTYVHRPRQVSVGGGASGWWVPYRPAGRFQSLYIMAADPGARAQRIPALLGTPPYRLPHLFFRLASPFLRLPLLLLPISIRFSRSRSASKAFFFSVSFALIHTPPPAFCWLEFDF